MSGAGSGGYHSHQVPILVLLPYLNPKAYIWHRQMTNSQRKFKTFGWTGKEIEVQLHCSQINRGWRFGLSLCEIRYEALCLVDSGKRNSPPTTT